MFTDTVRMTRSEHEIKSLFESMKGYSGGIFRRDREVCILKF